MQPTEIVLTEKYLELLEQLDPDGTRDIDVMDQISMLEQYAHLNKQNADNLKIAKNTTFFWMTSNGDVFGIFTENGKYFIVFLHYQGDFYTCGNTISNWVHEEYPYIAFSDRESFEKSCLREFGIPIIPWNNDFPSFTVLD